MARIKLRRDTAANWTSANPTLDLGEPGYETDTEQMKIGNGVDAWTTLPYFAGGFDGGTIHQALEVAVNGTDTSGALILSGDLYNSTGVAGLLQVGPALNFSDINILASFTANIDDYAQIIVSNKNSGTSSSADIVVNNDSVLGGTIYGDFGINSTTFVGTGGPFDQPDGTYLHAAGGSLAIGTIDPYSTFIATNDTNRIEIANNGEVEFKPSARVTILNTTDSTAHNTGALVIEGGLGVGKTIVADDNLYLGQGAVDVPLTDPVIVVRHSGTNYIQSVLINSNDSGSADFTAYTDSSTETEGFGDFGFTGPTFNDPAYTITPAGSTYLFAQGMDTLTSYGNLVLSTGDYGIEKDIVFSTGGFLAANERMRLDHSAQQLLIDMATSSVNTTTGALVVNGGVGVDQNLNVGGNINKVVITPPATQATLTMGAGITLSHPQSLTFPSGAGSSGNVLTTNGSGTLSWTAQSALNITKLPYRRVYDQNYLAVATDNIITIDPNGGSYTVTLPHDAGQGKVYTIKKIGNPADPAVTIDTNNVFCTIDGSSSYSLTGLSSVTVVLGTDGTNDVYYVIGEST